MENEKSCGAVLYTRINDVIHYVLVRQKAGFWGFPKGHVEAGETEEETALREMAEEVHIQATLLEGFRTTDTYSLPKKEQTVKEVVFFCACYYDQEIKPQKEELTSALLLPYEEALRLLTFDSTKRVLREAHAFIVSRRDADGKTI